MPLLGTRAAAAIHASWNDWNKTGPGCQQTGGSGLRQGPQRPPVRIRRMRLANCTTDTPSARLISPTQKARQAGAADTDAAPAGPRGGAGIHDAATIALSRDVQPYRVEP